MMSATNILLCVICGGLIVVAVELGEIREEVKKIRKKGGKE